MLKRALQMFRHGRADTKSEKQMMPPLLLQQFVGGDYERVGEEFRRYLVELTQLQPNHTILDVGCGSGRIAVPLTRVLDAAGRYDGFDVSRTAIEWCSQNITRQFPNFEFRVADIHNGPYNPKGKYKPSEFRFPYADGTFDVVLLASVFTHMFPADIEHYMREIGRVLKPSGRCLGTFFLLNAESLALISEKKGKLNFEHVRDGYRTIHAERPEEGMAYPEAFVLNAWQEAGLQLRPPVRYGSWCGRPEYLSFQDIVIAAKAE